jgi:2-polyprenyl-3-methyl-5-hydroxy-6-metoxy-1,4-benzoquinol methylase
MDVSKYFHGLEKISIYKCRDTGMSFFYPLDIAGDGEFYEKLQQFDWYYMDWKWEHESAMQYITPNMEVLEIGCAKGAFISKISKKGVTASGLELNEDAVELGKKRGLRIFNETIQEHARTNPGKYDLVCSFQVMEHIPYIREVLEASVAALKKGGKLIVSVPNNDSFLGLSVNYLNMPPHHMGLWNEEVFKSMARIFNLKLLNVHFEPLQKYHEDYFANTIRSHYLKKYRLLSVLPNRLVARVLPRAVKLLSKKMAAFTVQGVFQKL